MKVVRTEDPNKINTTKDTDSYLYAVVSKKYKTKIPRNEHNKICFILLFKRMILVRSVLLPNASMEIKTKAIKHL